MVHVSDLSLQYCVGCGSCYKTGACIYKDDIENLSLSVADADGIIIGSPTYSIIFRMGIQPFVKRKGLEYEGVIKHWKDNNIVC